MATSKSILLLGTGFLGRHIIDLFLAKGIPITAFLRNAELAATLEKAGAKTVLGTLEDLDLITTQVAEHGITINTSSSDDVPSVQAILAGVRQRVLKHLPTTFIHTSGAGLFVDDAKGGHKSDKVYRDDDPADIDSLPPTAMHRNVDLVVLHAAGEFGDKARVVIFIPPAIYGFNRAHQRLSMALPSMVRFALKHGYAGRVNEGLNAWSAVHVADLARAYTTFVASLDSIEPSVLLKNPYFFIDDGNEFTWGEAAAQVGRILHQLCKIESPEPRTVDSANYGDLYGPMTEIIMGGNSRSRGIRLRELGWKPQEKSIWQSMEEDEVPFIVATHH